MITTPQQAEVKVADGKQVINLCANNYLGLANHPRIVEAAEKAVARYGFGMASVRFICGTQDVHKELEARITRFLATEDTILYSSCFDANGGCFETLLGPEDAVVSDALNHASIIDGIRLCKAKRFRYANNDMADLRAKLEEVKKLNDGKGARRTIIATVGARIMDAAFDGQVYLVFDELGGPLRELDSLEPGSGGTILIEAADYGVAYEISVEAMTGRVDVTLVEDGDEDEPVVPPVVAEEGGLGGVLGESAEVFD